MPNLKIYVDESIQTEHYRQVAGVLPDLRDMLCRELAVPTEACQLAIVTVLGLPDQPLVNAEIMILPKSDRTPQKLRAVCDRIRQILSEVSGAHVAVRAATLDPETYIALK
ncbi:hypothetical protein [Halomonas aquatica]|uniref:Uncharacterized protein n=1 Tax=Halomonas aquatica TaxID=3151123 RepID=A0ABV1NF62_9GAMM